MRLQPPAVGVVIPLRSFTLGKARLAEALDDNARAALAREMADRVVDAAGDRRVVIVSSAPEVVAWAATRGLACIDDPGSLDDAASSGRSWARERGCGQIVVAHADLPFVTTLDEVTRECAAPTAFVVPDQRADGTPVLSIPAPADFRFAYGPGSFERHVDEARRLGLEVQIVRDDALGFDVDLPEDLARLELPASCHPRP
jgi:2-phospho-L-lactate guanylyltransferase